MIAYYVPNELYELYVGYEFSGFRVLITILVISMSMTLPYLILVNYFYYSGLNNIIAICALVSAMIYVIMILNLASLDIIMVAISLMSSNLIMIFLLLCFFMKNKK
ncbi:hypothetical protein BCT94_17640 [Vibrio breoganii]|nr:hypothetical protein BCT94_17640 [Vibrio breoganii]